MPAFEVEYSIETFSQLKDLNKPIAKRIVNKIDKCRFDPHRFFKRLTGRPEFKLRIGDYRVIAVIQDDSKMIFIQSIGHRSRVYERK